jgi:hypothetical protein
MVHHSVKIDATRYSRGQREESIDFPTQIPVTLIDKGTILIGSNTDGFEFKLIDLWTAVAA